MKMYLCRENDTLYTRQELVEFYANLFKECPDEYAGCSFNDVLRDCLGKNGALEEVSPITIHRWGAVWASDDKSFSWDEDDYYMLDCASGEAYEVIGRKSDDEMYIIPVK